MRLNSPSNIGFNPTVIEMRLEQINVTLLLVSKLIRWEKLPVNLVESLAVGAMKLLISMMPFTVPASVEVFRKANIPDLILCIYNHIDTRLSW